MDPGNPGNPGNPIHILQCVDHNCIIISLKHYTVVQEFCDYGNRIYFARATYIVFYRAVENVAKCFKPCDRKSESCARNTKSCARITKSCARNTKSCARKNEDYILNSSSNLIAKQRYFGFRFWRSSCLTSWNICKCCLIRKFWSNLFTGTIVWHFPSIQQ